MKLQKTIFSLLLVAGVVFLGLPCPCAQANTAPAIEAAAHGMPGCHAQTKSQKHEESDADCCGKCKVEKFERPNTDFLSRSTLAPHSTDAVSAVLADAFFLQAVRVSEAAALDTGPHFQRLFSPSIAARAPPVV